MRHPGHGIKIILVAVQFGTEGICTLSTLHPRIGCYNKPHDLAAILAVVSPVHVSRKLVIDGTTYIRSRDAARIVQLAPDYVSAVGAGAQTSRASGAPCGGSSCGRA
jgi:hypothetical protein